jgi:hypothetical protein
LRWSRHVAALVIGVAAAYAFLRGALHSAEAFPAVFLCLIVAACAAPFLTLRALGTFSVGAVAVCLLPGLFVALFAATAHAIGRSVYRPAVTALALALIATFFYWDELFLFDAADRSASAGLAYAINPAAAAASSLDFDWMHAKALYGNSQTAESMFNVPTPGMATYSGWLLAFAVPFGAFSFWRERRE